MDLPSSQIGILLQNAQVNSILISILLPLYFLLLGLDRGPKGVIGVVSM